MPVLDETATLPDYLSAAALNNPGLKAAYYRWQAALEKIPQARSLPDPVVSYSYFVREVETRVGPQKQKVGFSQMFPWFGTLQLRRDVAAEAARVEYERYRAFKLKLFYEVKRAYLEYYYLARSIRVTEANVDLLRQLENVVRIRYETGEAGFDELVRVGVEVDKLKDRLRSLNDLREPLSAKLAAALGHAPHEVMPWPRELPEAGFAISDRDLEMWAEEKSPDIKIAGYVAAREAAAVDLAGKSLRPDFTLGLDYIDTDEAINPGVTDSGKDPLVARLSMNLPLWIGQHRAEKREAEARYRAAEESQKNRTNTLLAEVKLAVYHYRDAGRRIDLYGESLLPKARQAMEVTRQSFAAGSAGFLDFIDAERTVLEFELAYERARADRAIRLAELEMLTGEDISGMGIFDELSHQ
jgi:outer membrane protein TolC